MIFDRNEQKEVIALLGAGSMGTAIVRRIAAGKTVLLGDINPEKLEKAAHDFQYSGYSVETRVVDATDRTSIEAFARKAASLGPVKVFINTAGASPNQAKPEHILKLDLMGTGYAVDAFGQVMASGGAGLLISSQTGYMMRLPDDVEQAILSTPTEELLDLPLHKRGSHAESRYGLYCIQAGQPPPGHESGGYYLEGSPGTNQYHKPWRHRHTLGL